VKSSVIWEAPSARTGGCDREIMIRLDKANSAFGRLGRILASRSISTSVKVRLYESLVLPVLLYGAETWPMKQTFTKKLEAAHHRWLRKILRISWKDKVTNERIRQLTQQPQIEDVIRERRMRWTGHLLRMGNDGVARVAIVGYRSMAVDDEAGLVWIGYRR